MSLSDEQILELAISVSKDIAAYVRTHHSDYEAFLLAESARAKEADETQPNQAIKA